MEPRRLLIVHNGTAAADLASRLLEGQAGYRIRTAADCGEARELVQQYRPDLILLGSPPHDHCLPPFEQLQKTNCEPVIVALLDANERERYLACHQQGALDCLMAPFSLEQLTKSVERCLAIKSLEREKQDFISMLSHDLKNPITAAIGSIDLVREKRLGPLNREQAAYLASAIESCNEVVAMIDNLLDVHRFEAGKIRFNRTVLQLSELLPKLLKGYQGIMKQAQIHLHSMVEDHLPPVLLDRPKFVRVLGNLLANAIKFTPVNGSVTVSCCSGISEDNRLVVILTVKDSGEGIAVVDLPFIFDRFVQARNQSGRGSGGCGLGLAFCKMVVEAHGGTISVRSTEGEGSEFVVVLPATETDEEV